MSSSISKNAIKKYYEKVKKMTYKEIYNQLLDEDEDSIKFKLLNRRLTFLKNNKQEKTIRALEKESNSILDKLIHSMYESQINNNQKVEENNTIQNQELIDSQNKIKYNSKQIIDKDNFIKPYADDSYGVFASYP
tara:strand:+ start:96 stop:500 length:405 start_codon:yes stop_codon:yes gene_type:complete